VSTGGKPVTRIALGQIVSRSGDVEGNLERILAAVEAARAQGADHVVFPELALTGYLVNNTFAHSAVTVGDPMVQRLRDASQGIAITLGFIEETPTSLFYNSAACFEDGRILHLHRKIYLPTYGRFDERRYYGAGSRVQAFDTRQGRMAILICGDAWHLALPYLAAHDGADVILVLAASSEQGLMDTCSCEDAWQRMCQSYALTLSCFVVFVNQAHGSDPELHIYGGSFVAGPDGNLVAQSDTDGPNLVVADLDRAELRRQRIRLPFRRDDSLVHTIETAQRVLARKVERDHFTDGPSSLPPGKPL
jgi:predicted amidohydrolase